MTAAGLAQCAFGDGVMEGEGVEARLFEEYWLAAGVDECGAVPIVGNIGRVGVAGGVAATVAFLARTTLETALGEVEQLAQISGELGAV